jgi:transposase InsO family protein
MMRAAIPLSQPGAVHAAAFVQRRLVPRGWHGRCPYACLDLISLQILWFRFTAAAILDGFSRRLLQLTVYPGSPRQRDLARLVRCAVGESGKLHFLITDHGTQFHRKFHAAMGKLHIRQVKGRVRAPYLNGKIERAFRTFRVWWSMVLCGLTRRGMQRRLDNYRHWYNQHRPHSALRGLTPQEAWEGVAPSEPFAFRQRDPVKPHIDIRRASCRGDPRLPVIRITVQRAA